METFHQQELFTSEHRNNWFYKQIKQACPDKVCMDIGAGTGILSLFAIHAGAKHVYMIEHNSDCCNMIEKVFKSAKIPSTKYTIIQQEFNPDFRFMSRVDVIMSETISSNIFRFGYKDICKYVQNTPALKDAIMIPDKIYGSFVLFEDISILEKLKHQPQVITTGVPEVDKDFTFSSSLLEPSSYNGFYNARLWRQDVNPLYHELWDDVKRTTCLTMTDVVKFNSYLPYTPLEWHVPCTLPNKTYGIMLIGRIACDKTNSSKHVMNMDVWATYFYKFRKTSNTIDIRFDAKEKNFVFYSI